MMASNGARMNNRAHDRLMTRSIQMAATRLSELAKTIRSKNAGVDKITFDVIFRG
jgi:hypothetical protein